MTTQLHDTGEEYYQDKLNGESFTIMLFHDGEVSGDTTAGDNLSDAGDLPDITTEPTDGNYVRQTGHTFSTRDDAGDWVLETDNDVIFDVKDTTGRVDAYGVVVNFASNDKSDGGTATDHLLFTGNLSQDYLLDNLDQLTINAGTIRNKLS